MTRLQVILDEEEYKRFQDLMSYYEKNHYRKLNTSDLLRLLITKDWIFQTEMGNLDNSNSS